MHRKILLALLISAALPATLLPAGPQAEEPVPAVQEEKTPANDLAFEPTRVTLDVKDTRVRVILKEIRRQTGNKIRCSSKVGDVVFIRDYIEANHEFAGERSNFHQVEIMFRCELIERDGLGTGEIMDVRQVGVDWLPVDRLVDYLIYPKILGQVIGRDEQHQIYLGDVN